MPTSLELSPKAAYHLIYVYIYINISKIYVIYIIYIIYNYYNY